MTAIIENVGIALIAAGALAFVAYFLAALLKRDALGVAHYVCLGILFLLLSYQSYRFLDAWDEKAIIEETMEGISGLADNAMDFADELDRQYGVDGQTARHIREAMGNPLVQKGLKLFGISVSDDGQMTMEMAEQLKSEYNWYMFRRACWMLGFMVVYLIIAMFLPTGSTSSGYRSRTADRQYSHSSDRRERISSRTRRR